MNDYDVIVVGGGHAGCEAALAASRIGARTALVTIDELDIASMPCNPSVGGIGKSQLTIEVDALGGEIARNADYTGIQFKTLNTSQGPAVRSNRVQCDKERYSSRMRAVIRRSDNLDQIFGCVDDLVLPNGSLRGVLLEDGTLLHGRTVVITAGTFIGGMIHIGDRSYQSGRRGQRSSCGIGRSIRSLGIMMARLKTGTPPRLLRNSIDLSVMQPQPGDDPPAFLSWSATRDRRLFHVEHRADDIRPWPPGSVQMQCYITHTTPETHSIVKRGLPLSSLYGGHITGTGVRYCPSIEDKVVKFPDKESHHVFIEPEGRESELVYPNGISNSLPPDVQDEMVRSIPGLGNAVIEHWAYAIEYDFCDPTQLTSTLASKVVEGLFMAGQVNGTTGYEEAAAQGFVAGVNAACKALNRPPLVLSRGEAYIGVLIDDLVTKGTSEPYRMFTSRAEHRLLLRQDNARFRMLPFARSLGIADREFIAETESIASEVEREMNRLSTTRHEGIPLDQLLKRPTIHHADLPQPTGGVRTETAEQVEIMVKYKGYIEREEANVRRAALSEKVAIPDSVDYWRVPGLRREAREKLSGVRPHTIGQASRIPGITPADIMVIQVHMRSLPSS